MRHPWRSFILVCGCALAILLLACGAAPARASQPDPECIAAATCLDKMQNGGFETGGFTR